MLGGCVVADPFGTFWRFSCPIERRGEETTRQEEREERKREEKRKRGCFHIVKSS